MNSVMDISAARDCFNMASAVAEACGNGSDISKWNEYESKLPPYLYEPTGELKEWALACYEENYEHRHTSQLYGLWPAYEGETDNTLFEGARKLIETKNTVLPPTAGDNVAGHGWVHKGLIMARAKSAEGVRDALLAVLTNEMYYASMMTSHDTTGRQAYCTDTAITVPAILMESVVYSDSEVIELAPAIPDEMLSSGGNISGLRSRTGDAIENIEWSDEGISAVINADGDVKVKFARPFAKAVVNGEDVSEKLKTDESGESYITVSGKAEVEFVFTDTAEGTYEILNQDDLRLTANGVNAGTVEISAAAVGSGVLSNTVSLRIKSPIDGYSKITDYEVVGRTEGKWEQQSPPQNAFDGDISTVYDGQAGGRCGIKMSEPQKITAFRFQSGAGYEERMPGCVFRVSNDGVNYTAVYTISSVKPNGEWNYVYLDDLDAGARELLENNSFTYFEFYGEKYAPIAELDVYTDSEEESETCLAVTDDSGNELTSAGDAAAAAHINITVSVSSNDSGKELTMYAAQYDENGILISIDVFNKIKDGDKKETDIFPNCERIALYLWDADQAPVIDAIELN